MKPTNITESLKILTDACKELSTLTGNDDRAVAANWVRTTDAFIGAITTKTVNDYNKNKTSHNLRFPGIKKKFEEIYNDFEDDLNQDLFLVKDDKKILNDSWLRITKDIEENEFNSEDVKFTESIRENKGLKINIKTYSNEEKKKGHVDVELPLSMIYRAGLYIDKLKTSRKKYRFVILYGIFNCFKFSLENISPKIQEHIDSMYSQKDTLFMKETDNMSSTMNSVKNNIAPLINSNVDFFSQIFTQMDDGINQLTDDNVDDIAEQCEKVIALCSSNNKKGTSNIISEMMGVSEDKVNAVRENMGLQEGNIRSIIDRISGGVDNTDLLKSIPKMDEFSH